MKLGVSLDPLFPRIDHRHVEVDGVRVFFRESRPERADVPVLLLLHGFPSGSHQFLRLIDALGSRYRVIAPDLPGFGHTQGPEEFVYTFDSLADVIENFARQLGLSRFAMYVFDFGAPVGFRIIERHPSGSPGWWCRMATPTRKGCQKPPAESSPWMPAILPPSGHCRTFLPLPQRAASMKQGFPTPV
ncbi:alpha/beta fold hydrolase [Arthrobacter sp. ISL-72]|nr:alpha/beta fold hydrolase [Arthrobacter sp. ISL-72]